MVREGGNQAEKCSISTNTKETMLMIKSMAMEFLFGPVETPIRASTLKTRDMAAVR
jgi:hypothetical protein